LLKYANVLPWKPEKRRKENGAVIIIMRDFYSTTEKRRKQNEQTAPNQSSVISDFTYSTEA